MTILRRLKIVVVSFVIVAHIVFLTISGSAVYALEEPTAPLDASPSNQLVESQLTQDILPPTIPINGTPHTVTQISRAFSFAWTASQDDGLEPVTYEFRTNQNLDASNDIPEVEGTWYSPSLTSPTMAFATIPTAPDGVWYWQARAVDAAENKSEWSEIWQVRVDTQGPLLTFHQPDQALSYGGQLHPMVTVSATVQDAADIASYRVERDGSDITTQLQSNDQGAFVSLEGSFSVLGLSEGEHALKLVATDQYGNISELNRVFIVDTIAPVISTNISDEQIVKGVIAIEFSVAELHLHEYTLSLLPDRNELQEVTFREGESQGVRTYEFDTTKLTDGTYHVRFLAKDAAGNETELIRTITIDNSVVPGQGVVAPDVFAGTNDPLLEELSKQLSQPFIAPRLFDVASLAPSDASESIEDDVHMLAMTVLPKADQNALPIAVIPSESGWRIFGIVWYWWLFLILAVTFAYRRTRTMQSIPA